MQTTVEFKQPFSTLPASNAQTLHSLRRVIDGDSSKDASIAAIANGRKWAADLWDQYSHIKDLVGGAERTLFGEKLSDLEAAALTGKPWTSSPPSLDSDSKTTQSASD